MKKLSLVLTLALVACVSFGSGDAWASVQASPSYGKISGRVPTRTAAKDGNGVQFQFPEVLGYKVFEDSASAAAVLLTDELGNSPVCGILHKVCINGGANYTVGFDTNTASGVTVSGAGSVTGQLNAVASVLTCATYDVQFNAGLAVVNSDANGASYWYWRTCGQGNQ